jgi:hypothetical protein
MQSGVGSRRSPLPEVAHPVEMTKAPTTSSVKNEDFMLPPGLIMPAGREPRQTIESIAIIRFFNDEVELSRMRLY